MKLPVLFFYLVAFITIAFLVSAKKTNKKKEKTTDLIKNGNFCFNDISLKEATARCEEKSGNSANFQCASRKNPESVIKASCRNGKVCVQANEEQINCVDKKNSSEQESKSLTATKNLKTDATKTKTSASPTATDEFGKNLTKFCTLSGESPEFGIILTKGINTIQTCQQGLVCRQKSLGEIACEKK